jgi:hypothetical protein
MNGDPTQTYALNTFIRISANGAVILMVNKSEMGYPPDGVGKERRREKWKRSLS